MALLQNILYLLPSVDLRRNIIRSHMDGEGKTKRDEIAQPLANSGSELATGRAGDRNRILSDLAKGAIIKVVGYWATVCLLRFAEFLIGGAYCERTTGNFFSALFTSQAPA